MAVSTKKFTLSSSEYQDISEGMANCLFRLPFRSPKNNPVRVVLGTTLPTADTDHFDRFDPPENAREERQVSFSELDTTDRVYVRRGNDSGTVELTVYRK